MAAPLQTFFARCRGWRHLMAGCLAYFCPRTETNKLVRMEYYLPYCLHYYHTIPITVVYLHASAWIVWWISFLSSRVMIWRMLPPKRNDWRWTNLYYHYVDSYEILKKGKTIDINTMGFNNFFLVLCACSPYFEASGHFWTYVDNSLVLNILCMQAMLSNGSEKHVSASALPLVFYWKFQEKL